MQKRELFSELDRSDPDEAEQDVLDELRAVEDPDEDDDRDDDRDEGEGSGELARV